MILGPHPVKAKEEYLTIIQQMTDDELHERASYLSSSIASIKAQKVVAEMNAENNWQIDRNWLHKAKISEKIKAVEFSYTTSEIHRRNRAKGKIRSVTNFEDVAKKYLPTNTYNMLCKMCELKG